MASTQTRETQGDRALTEASVLAALRGTPHAFLDVGHSRIAAWRFGRGPDVVCVHGWPLSGLTFRRLVPALAARFTVHVIDLPGAGQTETRGDAPITLTSLADDLRRVIDLLGLTRFAFVGHDSGAAIARFAAADDRRVHAIVMGNTEIPGHHAWQISAFKLLAHLSPRGGLLTGALRIGPIRRSALGFGGCFTDPAYVDGDFGALFLEPMLTSPRVVHDHMKLIRDFTPEIVDGLAAAHARIGAPVLCIWGEDDTFFPVAKAEAMLTQLPGGATLVRVPHGRLFAHEDHPDAFLEAALPFLRQSLG